MKVHSTLSEIQRHFYAAFKPPPQVHSAEDAIAALDIVISGNKLPPGEAAEIARRVKRWISQTHLEQGE